MTGCKKSAPQQPTENPNPQTASQPAPTLDTVARIHWLGKRRLAGETNAASFMSIWAMPESQKLEAQTLDKLALAPWNLPREGTNTAAIVATNANSLLLRPLLEDLLQEECYLEIRSSLGRGASVVPRAGNTTEIALAIRIDDNRSHLWKTNLTAILNTFTNHTAGITNHPTFLRTANWTVIAFLTTGNNPANAPLGQNDWIAQLTSRLGQNSNLFTAQETNTPALRSASGGGGWLESDLDLIGISAALGLGWNLPAETPKILLTAVGEGDLVRSTAQLKFDKPLPLNLEPWNIPTNLVHDPLTSFTAIRGIKSFLSLDLTWNSLQLGPPPNQLYFWAQGNLPLTIHWAAPLPDASNHVYQFTEHLTHDVNPWLETNSMGQVQRATNGNAAIWGDLPFVQPYLKSITLPEGDFIAGSVGAAPFTNRPVPPELFEQFLSRSNLVYYDWELTGTRIDPCLYTVQFLRFAFKKAQISPDSLSIPWLKALELKLRNSATMVALSSPETLSFVRRSTIGLTGVELQILVDWLESPTFPHGLNTFVAEPPPPPGRSGTNSAPHRPAK